MSNELDLRDYFNVIRKRIWWITGFVLAITILTGLYSKFIIEPVYQASTKIIVNRSTSNVSISQQLNSDEVNTNIRLINTYKEIIKTPAILDKVVEKHPEFGLTSDQLMGKIKVNSVNDTQVMTVIVSDTSYKLAAQIANAVSEVFKEEIPSVFNVQNVSILNQAKVDSVKPSPVSPNIPLNVIVAFIVSFIIAVGLAFLLEYLDDTIKTEADVERYLELPTLAMIAKVNPDDSNLLSKKKTVTKRQAGELSHATTSE